MKKTPLYPNPSPSSLPDVVDGPFGKSILPARPVLEVRRTEVFVPGQCSGFGKRPCQYFLQVYIAMMFSMPRGGSPVHPNVSTKVLPFGLSYLQGVCFQGMLRVLLKYRRENRHAPCSGF